MAQTAEWWRDYRAKNAEKIRAYNKARRQKAEVKAQRHASESRRRSRIRQEEASKVVYIQHPLLDRAAAMVGGTTHGAVYQFTRELLNEDLKQEAVLAMLERVDPMEAIAVYRNRERQWCEMTRPMFDGFQAEEEEVA